MATAAAIVASVWLRFDAQGLADRFDALLLFLPGFLAYAATVYLVCHLYTGKWRFTSLPDLNNMSLPSARWRCHYLCSTTFSSPRIFSARSSLESARSFFIGSCRCSFWA